MIDLEDDELLESIARKSRLMQMMAMQQSQLIRAARQRGIPDEEIKAFVKVSKDTNARRKARRAQKEPNNGVQQVSNEGKRGDGPRAV